MADPRLENLPTALAALCRIPTARPPGHQRVSADALGAWPLQLDDELSQELRMPLVFVRFEEFVRLLVRKEVKDQGLERGGRADLLV